MYIFISKESRNGYNNRIMASLNDTFYSFNLRPNISGNSKGNISSTWQACFIESALNSDHV